MNETTKETAIARSKKTVQDHPDRLWSIGDLAAWLHVGESTAYKVAAQPTFPKSIRIAGKCRRWMPSEIKAWAARQR